MNGNSTLQHCCAEKSVKFFERKCWTKGTFWKFQPVSVQENRKNQILICNIWDSISSSKSKIFYNFQNIYQKPVTYSIVNHVVLNIRTSPNHFIIFKLGTNKWYFFNDNACLTEENKVADNVYIEDINFSTCGTNEFNCFDGTW